MEKYIKQLLVSDSRAIIPGFGAIQALKEDDGYSLSFNKYLCFDDGKLAGACAAAEAITANEADERVSRFVESCKDKIAAGESVEIAGVGSFKNDADGDLVFLSVDVFDPTAAACDPDAKAADDDLAVEAAPVEAAPDEAEANEPAPDEAEANEPAPVEPAPVEPAPVASEDSDEKKRRWLWVLLILLLLLFLIGLMLFVVFKDNPVYRAFFGGEKPKTEVVTKPKKEEPKPAEPKAEEPKAEPVVEAPKEVKPEPTEAVKLTKRYNIIVGAYSDESGAIARVKALRAKGYDDAFVGIRKDKFVAVIGAFSNLTQAEAMQEKIVDGPDHIESWITNSGE